MIQDLLFIEYPWVEGEGEDSEFVLFNRVNFFRNIKGLPFVQKASERELNIPINMVRDMLNMSGLAKEGIFLTSDEMDEKDMDYLVESHIIESTFKKDKYKRGIYISRRGDITIMVNHHEHLTIGAISSGLDIKKSYELSREVLNYFNKNIEFSFSETFGFLSSFPLNTGVAMGIEVFMHLPAIGLTKHLERILNFVEQSGCFLTGWNYRKGATEGFLFKIKGIRGLGTTEEEFMEMFKNLIKEIIELEKEMQNFLTEQTELVIKDKVYKSLALLKNGLLFTENEAINLLSTLRFGKRLGLFDNISFPMLNSLLIQIQPLHIEYGEGKMTEDRDIDLERGSLLRRAFRGTGETYGKEKDRYS